MPAQPSRIACRPTSGLPRSPHLGHAYAAMDRGDWTGAATAFRAAASEGDVEALEGLGFCGFLMRVETEGDAYEAAFEAYQRDGDSLGAGRIAALFSGYWYIIRGQFALANGWMERAHSILEPLPEAPEHGWLHYFEAQRDLYGLNDSDAALRSIDAAIDIGRRYDQPGLVGMAMAFQGLLQIYQGQTTAGLSRLDEAATACVSGEIREPWLVNSILCSMMEACDKCRDWDRANEWFGHISELAAKWGDAQFYAQCRPHYAAVLTWRGEWQQAEEELQLAIDSLSTRSKAMATEGIVRLAELRWRQGRWDEAATLFESTSYDTMSVPGQALLALDQGNAAIAYDLCERLLSRLPLSGRIERVPALEAFVRACIAKGSLDECGAICDELKEISKASMPAPQRATACLALGLIAAAQAEPAIARRHLEDAIELFDGCAAPFEAARARLELASVFEALGRAPDAARIAAQACTTFQGLGAIRESARAQDLIRRFDDASLDPVTATVAGLSQREVEVLSLLAAGLSNQEIADRLVLSIRTVQRHVENIYAKTGARGRAAAAVFATTHHLLAP